MGDKRAELGGPLKQGHDCRSDLVVKEQVVLKQMLVCYESILAGESRVILVMRCTLHSVVASIRMRRC